MKTANIIPDIQCIIFDCDNVLVDTETTMISVLLDMASAYGVKMDLEEAVSEFSGRHIRQTIQFLETRSSVNFPEDFEQHFRKRTYDEFRKGVQPIEGVKELLQNLNLPFCVASSGPREKIELNLHLTGLLDFFSPERIFSSYDIQSWKPDPGIFLHAAKSMGYPPERCVVIEDSLAGIEAAKKGGFRVYGLTNGYNQEALRAKGAIIFEQMKALPEFLNIV